MTDPLPVLLMRLLTDRYGLSGATISRFDEDHPIFLVSMADQRRVIRVGQRLDRYAAALSVLERAGIPGPKTVPDRSGRLVSTLDGRNDELLMIDHVDGGPLPLEPGPLEALGAALGRLHRAGPAAIAAAAQPPPGLPVIERAGMLPANELRFGLSRLEPAAEPITDRDRFTDADRAEWRRLVDACRRGLTFGAGLTEVFLHGDAHPWNSLLTPAGEVALIDWDSAGPGPAVIDLAFLAVSCATGGLTGPPIPPDPARLAAVAAGYRRELRLSEPDLDALPDAMAFRVLVAAAVGFGHVAAGRSPLADPTIQWSLTRLRAIPELAATLRRLLA